MQRIDIGNANATNCFARYSNVNFILSIYLKICFNSIASFNSLQIIFHKINYLVYLTSLDLMSLIKSVTHQIIIVSLMVTMVKGQEESLSKKFCDIIKTKIIKYTLSFGKIICFMIESEGSFDYWPSHVNENQQNAIGNKNT